MIPLGGVVAGVLAETIGLRETIAVGAVGGVLAVIPLLTSPIRSIGRMSELDGAEPQSPAIASASSAHA